MGSLRRQMDGTRVVLSADFIVGRQSSCQLLLEASFVSSAHALIRWTAGQWELRDLGSTNGTFIDGERVAIGTSVRIKVGTEIAFGDSGETWRVIDDREPGPVAIPQDGGEPSFVVSGIIAIPDASDPQATIYQDATGWTLEMDHLKVPLHRGQLFRVAGREWRFECPGGSTVTRSAADRQRPLADVSLCFHVSSNEEYVSLRIMDVHRVQDLGHRACFYLALVLSRIRLDEQQARVGDAGWLDLEDLLRMVPEYHSPSHLNVEIFRLRRLLCEAGIEDAPAIVQRRRGQIRFGTDRVKIVRADDNPRAVA
jgi:hypothetical protein